MGYSKNKFNCRVVEDLPKGTMTVKLYSETIEKCSMWIYKMIRKNFEGKMDFLPFEPLFYQGQIRILPKDQSLLEKVNFKFNASKNKEKKYFKLQSDEQTI